MFGIESRKTISCKTCGKPTPMLGTKLCDPCWEVETRLPGYLNNENAIQFVLKALNRVNQPTPAESRYGRQLGAVKPLAQYLAEYLQYEDEYPFPELLEQALDAYESTEQVKIRIERV